MSAKCWRTSLSRLLNQNKNNLTRLAIVGIGNEFRGDDAAGVLVARALPARETNADAGHILIIQAGHAPENVTGDLRQFAPELVLLIDSADMGEEAGAISLIPMEQIEGMSASTHSLPLSMLVRYLTLELNCEVVLLGIQPKSIELGEIVSAEVTQAVNTIVDEILALCFGGLPNPASTTMRGMTKPLIDEVGGSCKIVEWQSENSGSMSRVV
jgi:hydrogenase 3 maturation protease